MQIDVFVALYIIGQIQQGTLEYLCFWGYIRYIRSSLGLKTCSVVYIFYQTSNSFRIDFRQFPPEISSSASLRIAPKPFPERNMTRAGPCYLWVRSEKFVHKLTIQTQSLQLSKLMSRGGILLLLDATILEKVDRFFFLILTSKDLK